RSAARKEALLKAGAALDRVGLWERRDHRPTELSGGEMQRVAIARALAGNPSLILADEPTGNLDPVSAQGVLDVLTGLNKQGATIVLVTHDQKVSSRCGRVARLRAGRLCEEGAP
ncbi:MAG TPA: ATP-binding cassette domain-containing protein, partial [Candidatus Brocadiia bacterium]|nr:ATP-binding cassette domain-containing protein [Candidatus Brocadiia bacterium]